MYHYLQQYYTKLSYTSHCLQYYYCTSVAISTILLYKSIIIFIYNIIEPVYYYFCTSVSLSTILLYQCIIIYNIFYKRINVLL